MEASRIFKTVLPVAPNIVPIETIAEIDKIYELALAKGGSASILHNARGYIRLFCTRNYEEAILEFSQSLKDDENNEEALWGLGWAQSHVGKLDESQEAYEKQLAVSDEKTEESDSTRFSLIHLYLSQRKLEKALFHFKKMARNAWRKKEFVLVKEILENDEFKHYFQNYCKQIWQKSEDSNRTKRSSGN